MSKGKLDPLSKLANAAFKQAMFDAIRSAKDAGTPLIIWNDGRVQRVPPAQAELALLRGKRKPK